jgi:hypothetical protein
MIAVLDRDSFSARFMEPARRYFRLLLAFMSQNHALLLRIICPYSERYAFIRELAVSSVTRRAAAKAPIVGQSFTVILENVSYETLMEKLLLTRRSIVKILFA